MSASWTIRELREQVEESLAGDDAPANGQVRAVPDERTIRYYTTLGLLDRPQLRGRTALYGARHLAQLVAIKRYQSEGRPLSEIQQMLPAMDDHALARFTGIALATKPPRAASRRDFWREPAMELAEPEPEHEIEIDVPPTPTPAITTFLELTLAPGVRLAFHTTRPATDADASALLSAATPLLTELLRRHLITPSSSPSPSPPPPPPAPTSKNP